MKLLLTDYVIPRQKTCQHTINSTYCVDKIVFMLTYAFRFFTAYDAASSTTHIYKANTDVNIAPQRPLCVSCQIVPECGLNNAVMSPGGTFFLQVRIQFNEIETR